MVALLGGCGQGAKDAGKEPQQEIATFRSPVALQGDEVIYEAKKLLLAGNFTALEQRMAQYRRSGEAHLDGGSKLLLTYQGVAWNADNTQEWQKLHQQLEAWRKQMPQSISAPIALAFSYCHAYSFLRNNMRKSDKPEVIDQQTQQYLKRAKEILEANKASRKQCVGWFYTAHFAYSAQAESLETYNSIQDEGEKLYPKYDQLKFNRLDYLMRQASQQAGPWRLYLTNVAAKEGKNGDILAARMIWFVITHQVPTLNKLLTTEYDWPRVKRGFEQLMNLPDTEIDAVAGAYAKAAWYQNDRATARPLFERYIKNRADRRVWVGPEEFTDARNWALQ